MTRFRCIDVDDKIWDDTLFACCSLCRCFSGLSLCGLTLGCYGLSGLRCFLSFSFLSLSSGGVSNFILSAPDIEPMQVEFLFIRRCLTRICVASMHLDAVYNELKCVWLIDCHNSYKMKQSW